MGRFSSVDDEHSPQLDAAPTAVLYPVTGFSRFMFAKISEAYVSAAASSCDGRDGCDGSDSRIVDLVDTGVSYATFSVLCTLAESGSQAATHIVWLSCLRPSDVTRLAAACERLGGPRSLQLALLSHAASRQLTS